MYEIRIKKGKPKKASLARTASMWILQVDKVHRRISSCENCYFYLNLYSNDSFIMIWFFSSSHTFLNSSYHAKRVVNILSSMVHAWSLHSTFFCSWRLPELRWGLKSKRISTNERLAMYPSRSASLSFFSKTFISKTLFF